MVLSIRKIPKTPDAMDLVQLVDKLSGIHTECKMNYRTTKKLLSKFESN